MVMRTRTVTLPELAMIGGTRAALGAGIGLLVADRLQPDQRRAVGWTLLAVGILSTFPLAAGVLFRDERSGAMDRPETSSPLQPQPVATLASA
jgi:hypothetical protein